MRLIDRSAEKQALHELLDCVRAGMSRVLILRGAPGIGKSALLEYAVHSATDLQVLRTTAVESEQSLGFAGVHQLLLPLLDGVDRLPMPQRRALGVAFGLVSEAPADPFLVGLAVLTLLSHAAEDRPVLRVVDDGQWLDKESAVTLGFVARRLLAGRVGMLVGDRETMELVRHLQAGRGHTGPTPSALGGGGHPAGGPDPVSRGHVGESAAALVDAAARLGPLDPRAARDTLLSALEATVFAGWASNTTLLQEIARTARGLPPTGDPPNSPMNLLLQGCTARVTGGHEAAMPGLRRAIQAFLTEDVDPDVALRGLELVAIMAADLLDDAAVERLTTDWQDRARERGALSKLAAALAFRSVFVDGVRQQDRAARRVSCGG